MAWFFNRPKKKSPAKPSARGPMISFGGVRIPESESTNGMAFLGTTGSGKTLSLRLLMQSVLPAIGTGVDKRALVYDAKQDFMPLLRAICPKSDVVTTDPFDQRGVAWSISEDVRESRVSIETAFTLIPADGDGSGNNGFFVAAARHLLHGCMLSFIISGFDFSLADILRGLSSPRRLKAILKKHDVTRSILSRYYYDARLLSNIFSTLATKLLPLEPVASAWEHAARKVSLHRWAREEMVLVLGSSPIGREAIQSINRCMFARAVSETLSLGASFSRRNWFIVDELADAGRLDGIVTLAKRGRSSGGCLVICFQSLQGLRDPRLYGLHLTEELLGQIGNRFVGRLECPESAEFCSKHIGEAQLRQHTTSETKSNQGRSHTRAEQIVTQRTVLPSELMSIRPCTRADGLTAYFVLRSAGCFEAHFTGDELFQGMLIPPDPNVPEFIPRPASDQLLHPWTPEQAAKFGIKLKPAVAVPLEPQTVPTLEAFGPPPPGGAPTILPMLNHDSFSEVTDATAAAPNPTKTLGPLDDMDHLLK